MDNSMIPKAPCAMSMSEKGGTLESPAVGITPAITHEAAFSSIPSDEGIAIPFNSKFFAHSQGMEREEGEIPSSKPSSVTSDVPRWMAPPKRYSFDGGKRPRRSSSPESARHRLPSSRTYLNRSPESLIQPSSRRSQSPSHSRRPTSGRRTHSPEGPRRRRSTPGAKTFEPAPPRSPRSATQKRRRSDYDTRRRKDSGGESYLPRETYKESLASPYSEGHKDAFFTRDVSNHSRGRGSTREHSVESSHTQQSKPSINSNDHKTDHHRSLSRVPTTPSPSSISRPLPDADSASSSQLVKPCHNVPGLWMVKSGRNSIEIVTCEFEIDKIAADRWGIRGSSRYVCSSQSWKWMLNVLLSDMAKKRHTMH